ncbi:hypothetical protein V5799_021075, partial [Amblyomma americanum]
MKGSVVVAVLLKAFFCASYEVQRPTDLGPVGGRKIEILGTTIEEYRGIPFAEPPIGEHRFKPPVPAKPWDGTLNATSRRSGCPQPMLNTSLTDNIEYGEDCLHLNVWAREGSSNAPVLVWIYGGGFTYSSASHDYYTGAVIAAKTGIVVASMNYRLGVLGFLNADSPEAPGNMGMLDQNLALKSADELVLATFRAVPGKHMPFLPTYQNAFLPEEPSVAIRSGSFDTGVDLLTGVTSDEGVTLFSWLQPKPEILVEHLDNVDRETLINALHE